MNSERWRRLRDEVLACLALERGARAERLRALEHEDPELAREVADLVAEEHRAERICPGAALAPCAADAVGRITAGRRVGPWHLLRCLGRGGMGEVWEAERVDGGFHQRVAVKFMAGPLAARGLAERFRRERALLALLEHAHIARMLDGGETERGEPYIVMELVEGVPIDDWCDRRGLSVRERVALLAEVCDAVHFAHQRLVVHRDLKPANILVTEPGGTKLLDFGVAKLLEAGPAPDLTSAAFFTPRYASPEQVLGETVTTSSDVYSLAVVLFELLTGANPYGVPITSALQFAQAVAHGEPRRASECVVADAPVTAHAGGPRRLAQRLKGDLDRILAVGLAKDPSRRYATASALAEDLRRYLDDLPVAARDDGWTYRARKLVARHRLAALLLAALLVSLIAGLGLSWRTTARAVRAEARAQQRFDQVREMARTLVFGVHDRVAALGGSTELRRYLVDITRGYLDDLSAEGELAPGLAAEIAETYLRLAEVQGGHTRGGEGDVEGALASARRALALWESLAVEGLDVAARLAAAHGLVGDLERSAGRDEEALASYARLAELGRGRLERDPDDLQARHDVFRALTQHARVMHLQGDRRRALELELEAWAMLEPAARQPEVARSLVVSAIRIAEEHNALGEPARAVRELGSALELAQEASARAPADAQLALDHANVLRELARSHAMRQDWPAAFARLEEALAILRPIQAADARNFVLAEALSIALETLAGWRRSHGERELALTLYEESLALMEALFAAGPDDRHARMGVAQLTALAGLVQQDLGLALQAAERFERALELLGSAASDAVDESTAELRITVRLALHDLDGTGDEPAAGARLEAILGEAEALARRFPDVAWPQRKRGLLAQRLGSWLERRAALPARALDESRADLERARGLFETGAQVARRRGEKNWLLPSERELAALFEADLQRCDQALQRLEAAAGP